MWPQLPRGIRNPKHWEDEPETVCNPHGVPVIDLRAIAKALEEKERVKNKTSNVETNKQPSGEHLNNAKTPSKTWDNVGSYSSTSHYNSEPKTSDDDATMPRQGEE